MDIKKSFWVGFIFTAVISTIAILVSHYFVKGSIFELTENFNKQFIKESNVVEMHLAARSYTIFNQQMIIVKDKSLVKAIKKRRQESVDEYNKARLSFEKVMTTEDKLWLEQLTRITQQIFNKTDETIDFINFNDPNQAYRLYQDNIFPVFNHFEELITNYSHKLTKNLSLQSSREANLIYQLVFYIILLAVIIIILNFLVIIFITRKINSLTIRLQQKNKSLNLKDIQKDNDLNKIRDDLIKKDKQLNDVVRQDKLTNIYNRMGLVEMLENHIKHYHKYEKPFSILFLDIDNFKEINKRFGQEEGDRALENFAVTVQSIISSITIFGRWGSEEFLIICPATQADEAVEIAENIRQIIQSTPLTDNALNTVSIGVAQININDTINSLIKRADDGTCRAKKLGKNRVELITEKT